jgi:hypothetical protein
MTGKEKPAICYSTKTDRYKAKILPSNVGRIFLAGVEGLEPSARGFGVDVVSAKTQKAQTDLRSA